MTSNISCLTYLFENWVMYCRTVAPSQHFLNIFLFYFFQNLLEQPGKPISFNEKYKHFIYLLTHIFWICNNEHLEHSSNKLRSLHIVFVINIIKGRTHMCFPFFPQGLRLVEFRRISNPEVYVRTYNKLEGIRVLSMFQHWIKPLRKRGAPIF